MKPLTVIARTTSVALVFGAVTACSSDAEDSMTTTIAGGDHVGAAQLSIANAADLWSDSDITAEIQSFPAGREALNALLGGQADFATIGDLPVVTAVLGGQDIQIVSTLSWGTGHRLLTRADAGISTFGDLEGKTIGVPEGTNTQYLLSQILDDAGLSEQDVTIVNLSANQVPVALSNGDIDAGVTFPTFYAETQRILGDDLREIDYPGYESPTMLVTRSDVDDSEIESVLEVFARAQERIDENSPDLHDLVAEGSNDGVSVDAVANLWPLYRYELALTPELVDALSGEAEWAADTLDLGGASSPEAITEAITIGPLAAVAPESAEIG